MIHIGGRTYELVHEYRNAWNPDFFRERYSEVLERYDYILGDWGYNQLRLKGFFKEGHPKATKESAIASMMDYVNEYCNFGCAYFVLERVANKDGRTNPDWAELPTEAEQEGAAALEEVRLDGDGEAKPEGISFPARPSVKEGEANEAAAAGMMPNRSKRHARPERHERSRNRYNRSAREDKPQQGQARQDQKERAEKTDHLERNERSDRPERNKPNRNRTKARSKAQGNPSSADSNKPNKPNKDGGSRRNGNAHRAAPDSRPSSPPTT
ncbi:YutD-like domain-containing protein [Paenibacillus agilis]|uniref:DUF1027 domain-containing protein n=1 Tax=Paenibacillus agilis TaxID=3020863 RepID=A0A559IHD1_9BACL|nr:YutD family protein [Paenibacillus agilis]TVX87079.1 DUF1027 domain-containing protein [Paenibacillus agilis]